MAYKAHRDGDDVVIRVPVKDAVEFFDFTGYGAQWWSVCNPHEREDNNVGRVAEDLYFALFMALTLEEAWKFTQATRTKPTHVLDGIVRWGRIE